MPTLLKGSHAQPTSGIGTTRFCWPFLCAADPHHVTKGWASSIPFEPTWCSPEAAFKLLYAAELLLTYEPPSVPNAGITKFYIWLSERYSLLNQPADSAQIPVTDNLYLDMNGSTRHA